MITRLCTALISCILVISFDEVWTDSSCECEKFESTETGYPWLAGIARKQRRFCWGALINERYVLTVGHCVAQGKRSNATQLTVWLNEGTSEISEPPATDLIYNVEEIKLHPKYHLYNDIALIKLKTTVQKKLVRTVCFPQANDITFTGNGTTIEANKPHGNVQVQLSGKKVRIISNAACINGSKHKNIKETMICGDDFIQGSCGGDSGEPLIVNENGRVVLFGLASWDRSCSEKNPEPAVYARVSAFKQWIVENASGDAEWCGAGPVANL